jgi:formate hydrogenlyase subunit 3/multisubunit Na+/H+ antiporter MnhD subunit
MIANHAPWLLTALPLLLATLAMFSSRLGPIAAALNLLLSGALLLSILEPVSAGAIVHTLGGHEAPLGIALYLDRLSWMMLALTWLGGLLCSLYAYGWFRRTGHQASGGFWPLWLGLTGGMNALFVSGDLFNLYVALEVIGICAVSLTALAQNREAIKAATEYLLATYAASLAYLFGVGIIYGLYGTMDWRLLAQMATAEPAMLLASGLMIAALAMKAALFPLHFWLPGAHANALPPVSAILSALAIKGAFFLTARLYVQMQLPASSAILALLGSGAILYGGYQALRAQNIKQIIAYSTIAQSGYFFLLFMLGDALAWQGGFLQLYGHIIAKATLFFAAGNLALAAGSVSLEGIKGAIRAVPMTLFGAALAALSIAGLPPSGGFLAKWLLLQSAFMQSNWYLVLVLLGGGLLSAAYLFKLFRYALIEQPEKPFERPGLFLGWVVLLGGLISVLFGFIGGQSAAWFTPETLKGAL